MLTLPYLIVDGCNKEGGEYFRIYKLCVCGGGARVIITIGWKIAQIPMNLKEFGFGKKSSIRGRGNKLKSCVKFLKIGI